VRLDPNNSSALLALGQSLNYSYKNEEALPVLRRAIRLSPYRPAIYQQFGIACRETGRYDEGIAAVKKGLQLTPGYIFLRINLVALYSYAGHQDEARASAAEVLRIDPNFSLAKYAKTLPFEEGPKKKRFIDALRHAGLK
jgi:adenylate cyclase